MTFHVGQRVVCTNVTPRRDGLHPRYASTAIPVLGAVYTIRDIFDASAHGFDQAGLLLNEIVNPIRRYISQGGPVTIEQFWLAYRFRPLRSTNIDVFKAMLEPEPARFVVCELMPPPQFQMQKAAFAALLRAAEKLLPDAEAEERRMGNVTHLGAGPPDLLDGPPAGPAEAVGCDPRHRAGQPGYRPALLAFLGALVRLPSCSYTTASHASGIRGKVTLALGNAGRAGTPLG